MGCKSAASAPRKQNQAGVTGMATRFGAINSQWESRGAASAADLETKLEIFNYSLYPGKVGL